VAWSQRRKADGSLGSIKLVLVRNDNDARIGNILPNAFGGFYARAQHPIRATDHRNPQVPPPQDVVAQPLAFQQAAKATLLIRLPTVDRVVFNKINARADRRIIMEREIIRQSKLPEKGDNLVKHIDEMMNLNLLQSE